MTKQRRVPLRKCIASQEMFPKKDLVRVVKTSENEITIDLTGKKQGRGAYLCATSESIDLAQKKRALDHALKMQIKPDIYDQLRAHVDRIVPR